MQLGRATLSRERLRRLSSKSSLYCDTTGHYISTCPVKDTNTLEGHTGSLQTPTSHTPLHAILLWIDRLKSHQVLIDSVADEIFMDATLVSELGVSTQLLSTPNDARPLDRRAIGRVTDSKVPLTCECREITVS